MVCMNPQITLHHAHGGSMKERGIHRSAGRKNSDWLVIPLCANHHTGQEGIDAMGWTVLKWERTFGHQADMIDTLVKITGVDVWEKSIGEAQC